MGIDVGELLREFGLRIDEGGRGARWFLRGPGGHKLVVEPTPPMTHLNAHVVRKLPDEDRSRLLVAETATDSVVHEALAGRLDILIAHPPRLIHSGHDFALTSDPAPTPPARPRPARTAWTRWTIERYLLLATEPSRQQLIAHTVGTTQQSVSNAVRHLAGFVNETREGFAATNRAELLQHWYRDYAGPGGVELGWYSLDPVVRQVTTAREAADLLQVPALVSGDVAADLMAPWKLPARGRMYLAGPVDLENDGFVPAPLQEATLVTCVPADPSLWRLTHLCTTAPEPPSMPLADPAIVYWDLKRSGELDSDEAAEHLASLILKRPL
ncbi:hypothetical protein ACFP63_08505 [Oerskovia jenensis]|uniref:Uncharacterized protein n=1 Tax=Oerskovia jenensis TaxID=162169 RepID=A0ABS2LIJ9_9CELL|nr:hypothetical protein [Oerskovia jenensis]MBM7480092.1 hypothetical protein [Oerskovia jenensis]